MLKLVSCLTVFCSSSVCCLVYFCRWRKEFWGVQRTRGEWWTGLCPWQTQMTVLTIWHQPAHGDVLFLRNKDVGSTRRLQRRWWSYVLRRRFQIFESVTSLINLYLRQTRKTSCGGKWNVTTHFFTLMKHFRSLHWKTTTVHMNYRFTVYVHQGTKRHHQLFCCSVKTNHLTYDC